MNFKFAIIFTAMNIVTFSSFAVKFKLPNVQVLNQRLSDIQLLEIAQSANIIDNLADKELEASEIFNYIKKALNEAWEQSKFEIETEHISPFITIAVLSDYPKAIKELEQQGLL